MTLTNELCKRIGGSRADQRSSQGIVSNEFEVTDRELGIESFELNVTLSEDLGKQSHFSSVVRIGSPKRMQHK